MQRVHLDMSQAMQSIQHTPLQAANRLKRRQLTLYLGLALVVTALYPSLRDRVQAGGYLARLTPGAVLQATPQLYNPLFRDSDWLIVAHNEYGAWAVALGIPWEEGLERIKRRNGKAYEGSADRDEALWWGGPMMMELSVSLHLDATGVPTILLDEAHDGRTVTGKVLGHYRGHAGWLPGQLAQEIRRGNWRVSAGPEQLLTRYDWPTE